MSKEIIEIVAENMFLFGPMLGKKFFKSDLQLKEISSVNQLMVLRLLEEEESLSISEIGKKIYISKPQMTAIIDKLIKEDFVQRTYDEKDRRVINISLTEKGEKCNESVKKIIIGNLSDKLSSLSEGTLVQLSAAMETVINILKSVE